MQAIWTIAAKDMRLLVRDRMAFFFAFFFPLIVAVFFGMIFVGGGSGGGARRIDLLLVDEDGSAESASFGKLLEGASELEVTREQTRESALERVRTGKATAFIVIPRGFGIARESMFWSPEGKQATVVLGVDPSSRAESGMLEGLLTKYAFMKMQDGFQDPSRMREQLRISRERLKGSQTNAATRSLVDRFYTDLDAFLTAIPRATEPDRAADSSDAVDTAATNGTGWQPMRIERAPITAKTAEEGAPARPPTSFSVTFPQGIIWGVMGCALGFAASLVTERTSGTLIRLRVAPISGMHILCGKALACLITTLAVSVFLIAIGVIAFGVHPVSWPMLAVAVFCTSIAFVGIMMLLAVMSPSERSGNGLGWGVLLLMAMIGGGMLPLFFMPEWMKSISVISPIRWAILALEGGIWRGLGPAEMLLPCLILLGIGIGGLLIGARSFGLMMKQ